MLPAGDQVVNYHCVGRERRAPFDYADQRQAQSQCDTNGQGLTNAQHEAGMTEK